MGGGADASAARKLIPEADLQTLSRRYPSLRDRPGDLALEWLAHQLGDRLSAGHLPPHSVAARMWQVLRDSVARFFNRISGGRLMSEAALDAQVREMIQAARAHLRARTEGQMEAGQTGSKRSLLFSFPDHGKELPSQTNVSRDINESTASGNTESLELGDERNMWQELRPRISRVDKFTGAALETRVRLNEKLPDGEYLFVVDESGNTWTVPLEARLKHNSMVAKGEPVRAAGELEPVINF